MQSKQNRIERETRHTHVTRGGGVGLSVTLTTADHLLGGTVCHTHTHRKASTPP